MRTKLSSAVLLSIVLASAALYACGAFSGSDTSAPVHNGDADGGAPDLDATVNGTNTDAPPPPPGDAGDASLLPIVCSVGVWNAPTTSCTGLVVVQGSMKDSDYPDVAAANCDDAGVYGTCCMFTLFGVG